MSKLFKLQIIYPDGATIPFEGKSPFERELVASCVRAIVSESVAAVRTTLDEHKKAIMEKGVGFLRTEAHVSADIDAALQTSIPKALYAVLPDAVAKAMHDVLHDLKRETTKLIALKD